MKVYIKGKGSEELAQKDYIGGDLAGTGGAPVDEDHQGEGIQHGALAGAGLALVAPVPALLADDADRGTASPVVNRLGDGLFHHAGQTLAERGFQLRLFLQDGLRWVARSRLW